MVDVPLTYLKQKNLCSKVQMVLLVQVDHVDIETLQDVLSQSKPILEFAVWGQEFTRCVALKGKINAEEDLVHVWVWALRDKSCLFLPSP